MITAVSMNPCIDRTLTISKLEPGGTHRVKNLRQDISGKAVNVAHALKNLNIPCQVLGFDFAENGYLLKDSLKNAGIPYDYIEVPGAIRTNIKIFEEESQVMTEINEEGPVVSSGSIKKILEKAAEGQRDMLILSGSLPPGVEPGVYGKIIEKTEAITVLDTGGEALRLGLKAGAVIIKPNIYEIESTFGVTLPTTDMKIAYCRDMIEKYPELKIICLSLGAEGALIAGEKDAFFAPPMDIQVKGVQGAGDAMVAGIIAGLYTPVENCNQPVTVCNRLKQFSDIPSLDILLKFATASAAATLVKEGSLMGNKEDFDEMLNRVEIVQL